MSFSFKSSPVQTVQGYKRWHLQQGQFPMWDKYSYYSVNIPLFTWTWTERSMHFLCQVIVGQLQTTALKVNWLMVRQYHKLDFSNHASWAVWFVIEAICLHWQQARETVLQPSQTCFILIYGAKSVSNSWFIALHDWINSHTSMWPLITLQPFGSVE